MAAKKIIKTEEETWETVIADLKVPAIPLQYKVTFMHNTIPVTMFIDMDPGGGFESGLEFTSLTAPVPIQFTSLKASVSKSDDLRFALHDEGVMDRVGKFFGMEDIIIGYPEFDKQLIVKANDPAGIKKIFSNAAARKVFQLLNDFTLQLTKDEDKKTGYSLELMIERAITDTKELKKVYSAFTSVLDNITQ